MKPDADDVSGRVVEIWATMLGLVALPDGRPDDLGAGAGSVAARVDIAGDWRGTVTIRCDRRLARDLAAIMFHRTPEGTSPEMIEDAIGELANMTSGSLKSLLAGRCDLSLPSSPPGGLTVAGESATTPRRFGFACLDRSFTITVDGSPTRPGDTPDGSGSDLPGETPVPS